MRKRIADTIHSLEALAKNPLFMDTLIIDEMIAFYRDAIKSHRSQLLAIVCATLLIPTLLRWHQVFSSHFFFVSPLGVPPVLHRRPTNPS